MLFGVWFQVIKRCSFSPYLSLLSNTRLTKINKVNIWKANGFNNSSNTIEINYKLNHVKRNTNNFVAADCGNWHHISFASFVRGYWWIDFKMKSFIIITLEFTKYFRNTFWNNFIEKRPSIILFQILYKNPKLQSLKPLNQTLTLALQQQKWNKNEMK